jgi:LytR cell envelope-related transcriptional attenuator
VDHLLARLESDVRPWRTLTLVATAIAVVELLFIVGAFGVRPLIHHLRRAALAEATLPSAVSRPRPSPRKPSLTRSQTSVIVLNGNGVEGAAGNLADRVHARGYKIAAVDNAHRNDYARSVVMYRSGYGPEARRLARDLGIGVVGPLDGMSRRKLHGAHVAVIVGRH